MTLLQEIELASKQFGELVGELNQRALLETRNQCYAMLRAVLHEFRDHLSTAQAFSAAVIDAFPNGFRELFAEPKE
ncbi:MAG: hypothetical protein QF797_11625 [Alphaproteobacteria bacterium]|jgi:uncharacterized protein (DUF2267 family)|nr:hypothetical protein [Alphaproteobacteria bacterium]MDP6620660.1 hypothetical protein [Alphaproteobacteria bacterium]|tara:strand:+ start:358 stop:585 length:228 start_codon:yes stop_codon:yes gene_type:complete